MIPLTIERDVLIEASIDAVWRVLTDPAHMRSWFAEDAGIDVRAGGAGVLDFRNGETIQRVHLRVEAVDEPRYFAYHWEYPDGEEPRVGNSMLVEFTLTSEDGGTRLRVVETGLGEMPWSDEAKAGYAADHVNGWVELLASIRGYAPQQQGAVQG